MSSAIWDATNQKEIPISGLANINDSVISEDSTWSSEKINDSLVDLESALDDKVPFENHDDTIRPTMGAFDKTFFMNEIDKETNECSQLSISTERDRPIYTNTNKGIAEEVALMSDVNEIHSVITDISTNLNEKADRTELEDIQASGVKISKSDGTKKSLQGMYEDGELGGGVEIDDSKASSDTTYSSSKIVELTSKYAMSFNSSTGTLSITLN